MQCVYFYPGQVRKGYESYTEDPLGLAATELETMGQNYADEEYCNNLNDNKKSYLGDQFESTLVKGEYDWTDEKGQKGKYNICNVFKFS